MSSALIGHSGYVGSTLLRQRAFDDRYRSTNIHRISGKRYRLIVCAAAPGQKWVANQEPEADWEAISTLIHRLQLVHCERFVLISTVDVFSTPQSVDEKTEVVEESLCHYGLHRRRLERFVQDSFSDHLIVRLPGLVGPGLRKNIIFDLLHDNRLDFVDSRGCFQFYPMVNLWFDIQIALDSGLDLIHLVAEPISVAELSLRGFGRPFDQIVDENVPADYDMRTQFASLYGAPGDYQYSARDSVQAVRSYAQSRSAVFPVRRQI